MKVTKEKVEDCQAYLTIEMEPSEMEDGMQDAYRRLVQKADIPGFRKGKAPRDVVERTLGKSRLLEEAMDRTIPQAYEKALKEQEIDPFAQPEIEITQTDPLIFKAIVPLAPNVELGDYPGIRMSPEEVDITEEKVNEVLEEIRHQHATWEPADRALENDDMATIDIKGVVDEKPYVQKLGAQIQIVPDLMSPAPGFSEQVVGMKKDEEKDAAKQTVEKEKKETEIKPKKDEKIKTKTEKNVKKQDPGSQKEKKKEKQQQKKEGGN